MTSALALATHARDAFDLSPDEVHLNHGSFGAVPLVAEERRAALEREQRQNFHRFYDRRLFPLLDDARRAVADWLHADHDGFVFTRNASASVATALTCLDLRRGDRMVTTALEYPSTRANLRRTAASAGAAVAVVDVGGLAGEEYVDRVLDAVDDDTAAVVLSHVSSPWSTTAPVQRLHDELRDRRTALVIDGAHGPGLVEVDLSRLDSAFYGTTLHKWMCFPRGTGALFVPESHRSTARPLVDAVFADAPVMAERFAWSGTENVSGFLVAPEVLAVHRHAEVTGWNSEARLRGEQLRAAVAASLPAAQMVSDPDLLRMTAWRLPGVEEDKLRGFLRERGVWTWAGEVGGVAHLRVSAGWYVTAEDVDRLADALCVFSS